MGDRKEPNWAPGHPNYKGKFPNQVRPAPPPAPPRHDAAQPDVKLAVEAFAHEMTARYWRMTSEATRNEFLEWMRDDLERLATIVRAIR